MASAQTFEVDSKLAPVSVEALRVKFGNHGNNTIVVDT
jgi:hypothetical protein